MPAQTHDHVPIHKQIQLLPNLPTARRLPLPAKKLQPLQVSAHKRHPLPQTPKVNLFVREKTTRYPMRKHVQMAKKPISDEEG
jgi:hypothetical protein